MFAAAATLLGVLFGLVLLEIATRIFLVRRAGYIDQLHENVSRDWGGEITLFDLIRPASDSARVYEMIPGANGLFVDQPVLINDAGFRDRPRQLNKPPQVTRIALLGDSVAFGWGVKQQERFSDLLEQTLSTSVPRCEVLNFAVPGYNTVMELATLRDKVFAYQPDVLLLSMLDNDDEVPNFIRIQPQAWSLRRCFIYETIRDQMIGRKLGDTARLALGGIAETGGVGHGKEAAGFRPELVPAEYRFLVGSDAMASATKEIVREAKSRGIATVCIVHRKINKSDSKSSGTLQSEALVAIATNAGFQVIDPGPALLSWLDARNLPEKALWIKPDDFHPNLTAHRLLAEQIAPVIRDLLAKRADVKPRP